LTVVTGGVRSGKSSAAVELAQRMGRPVTVAVAGVGDGDPEMTARIDAHRQSRPAGWRVLEVAGVAPDEWLRSVGERHCLVVDCLGTMLAALVWGPSTREARDAGPDDVVRSALALADAVIARAGETIVVTNEVGWGVVPAYPAGRAFADALGAANRRLVDAAQHAYLVVCGRMIDLASLPRVEAADRERE
jgi:adenosylcobinamide kinase/adenosylcobinamide-phosphate guanylyltransferase